MFDGSKMEVDKKIIILPIRKISCNTRSCNSSQVFYKESTFLLTKIVNVCNLIAI
jgi:hypothetical protein